MPVQAADMSFLLNHVSNHFCSLAKPMYKAQKKIDSCAQLIKENTMYFFLNAKLLHAMENAYHTFVHHVNSVAESANDSLEHTQLLFIAGALAQMLMDVKKLKEDFHKLKNATKGRFVDNCIFYGLIQAPAGLAGIGAAAAFFARDIIYLNTLHLDAAWSFVGPVALLAKSTFVFLEGFHQFLGALMFSHELNRAIKDEEHLPQWLFEQAFIRSEKDLEKIAQIQEPGKRKKAFENLLKQQREIFIRRTSEECYNEVVKYFSQQNISSNSLFRGSEHEPVETTLETINKLYQKTKETTDEATSQIHPLIFSIYQQNFQAKVLAGIKMVIAILTISTSIALITCSAGLATPVAIAIILVVASFLQVGANAEQLHLAISNLIWDYQKHRVLPKKLQEGLDKTKQSTSKQIQFFTLATLATLTMPIWVLPSAAFFQCRGGVESLKKIQTA